MQKSRLFTLFVLGSEAMAAEGDLKKVEDVLDRLERNIKAVEKGEAASTPAVKSLSLPKATIQAPAPSLEAVAKNIAEIERELDQLEATIQKDRQKIAERASLKSSVKLSLKVPSAEQMILKSITVSMDGFRIYDLNQPGGLWLPHQTLPLLEGPIAEGSHRVEIDVTMQKRRNDQTAFLVDDVITHEKSFDFHVGGDKPAYEANLVIDEKSVQLSQVETKP